MREVADKTLRDACPEYADRLILFASDEVDDDERSGVREHIAKCPGCANALREYQQLLDLCMTRDRQEPTAALLASCRAGLVDALDRAEEKSFFSRWLDAFLPARWITLHPVVGGALLVIIGFFAGTTAPRLILSNRVQPLPVTARQAPSSVPNVAAVAKQGATVTPQTTLSDLDLRSADVTGIQWAPTGADTPPEVQVQLRALRPLLLQGTVDDDEVKNVLTNVLGDDQRFDPELRLNSIELLRSRNNDEEVCEALCRAARSDRDPAVRLKALEALSGVDSNLGMVRQTLMDALQGDSSADVRTEAVNTLREMAESGEINPDARSLRVFRDRAARDPSNYIRIQSAAIVRDLSQ